MGSETGRRIEVRAWGSFMRCHLREPCCQPIAEIASYRIWRKACRLPEGRLGQLEAGLICVYVRDAG